MRPKRFLYLGLALRAGGRWAVRRQYPAWSPTRWSVLLVLAWLPPRALGFLSWHGVLRYPGWARPVRPGPLGAAALVALWVALACVRDRLPQPVARRLLG